MSDFHRDTINSGEGWKATLGQVAPYEGELL